MDRISFFVKKANESTIYNSGRDYEPAPKNCDWSRSVLKFASFGEPIEGAEMIQFRDISQKYWNSQRRKKVLSMGLDIMNQLINLLPSDLKDCVEIVNEEHFELGNDDYRQSNFISGKVPFVPILVIDDFELWDRFGKKSQDAKQRILSILNKGKGKMTFREPLGDNTKEYSFTFDTLSNYFRTLNLEPGGKEKAAAINRQFRNIYIGNEVYFLCIESIFEDRVALNEIDDMDIINAVMDDYHNGNDSSNSNNAYRENEAIYNDIVECAKNQIDAISRQYPQLKNCFRIPDPDEWDGQCGDDFLNGSGDFACIIFNRTRFCKITGAPSDEFSDPDEWPEEAQNLLGIVKMRLTDELSMHLNRIKHRRVDFWIEDEHPDVWLIYANP